MLPASRKRSAGWPEPSRFATRRPGRFSLASNAVGCPLPNVSPPASPRLNPDRGVPLVGSLDISLYRDDLAALATVPKLRGSKIAFDVDGAEVILFDDVLYTGRTIRAALEELVDFGRPARVELAVLLDRGCRELPIQADYVGLAMPPSPAIMCGSACGKPMARTP